MQFRRDKTSPDRLRYLPPESQIFAQLGVSRLSQNCLVCPSQNCIRGHLRVALAFSEPRPRKGTGDTNVQESRFSYRKESAVSLVVALRAVLRGSVISTALKGDGRWRALLLQEVQPTAKIRCHRSCMFYQERADVAALGECAKLNSPATARGGRRAHYQTRWLLFFRPIPLFFDGGACRNDGPCTGAILAFDFLARGLFYRASPVAYCTSLWRRHRVLLPLSWMPLRHSVTRRVASILAACAY